MHSHLCFHFIGDAASVFGEQRKLEPMDPDRKVRWKKEVDWLLSVTDYIVEFVPSQQKAKDGTTMEVKSISNTDSLTIGLDNLFVLLDLNARYSVLPDNDYTTEKRFAYEHSGSAQAGHNAYCKKLMSLSLCPIRYDFVMEF